MQRHLYEHFYLPGHSGFFNDVSITLIEKTSPKDPKRDDYWIYTLKTKAPLRVNVEDGLLAKLIAFCITDYVYGQISFGQ